MVLSYSYLWNREAEKGGTSGRKDRPAAIVLVRTDAGPGELVYVVPITHSAPAQGDNTKIPIPQAIKERQGLDEDPSWVDVTEYNIFVWPGYDLKPTKARRGPDLDASLDDDIGDEMLRLIFTACHPLLSREARAALALRMICGLTTE